MEKINLVKQDKQYYSAKGKPELREFKELNFLTIMGKGEPAGTEFTKAVEALYPLAYGVKKIYKQKEMDFGVPKLEGLWWVKSDKPALEVPRNEWYWKLLIRMPDFVTNEMVNQAKIEVIKKKGIELIEKIQFAEITEGKCVQIMHIGPYSTEPETIGLMKNFMKENGLNENGLHHEIYISDPRKTKPERMKTVLRLPVKK
ncbi:MAG: GyrI-like domain-containing protein [Polaribacter sp.]|nr:GyrI-like domain-containing protein [Polaribacter sp.]